MSKYLPLQVAASGPTTTVKQCTLQAIPVAFIKKAESEVGTIQKVEMPEPGNDLPF